MTKTHGLQHSQSMLKDSSILLPGQGGEHTVNHYHSKLVSLIDMLVFKPLHSFHYPFAISDTRPNIKKGLKTLAPLKEKLMHKGGNKMYSSKL